MLTPRRSGAFRRDVRKAEKRGKDLAKLRAILALLVAGSPLPHRYKDHPLKGDWSGFRDAHIEPDWLLIYPHLEQGQIGQRRVPATGSQRRSARASG